MPRFIFGSPHRPGPRRVALPWYRVEDWEDLHALFVERDAVPAAYGTWLERAVQAEARYRALGYDVVRVVVAPDELVDWCLARRRRPTMSARHEYAQSLLALQVPSRRRRS